MSCYSVHLFELLRKDKGEERTAVQATSGLVQRETGEILETLRLQGGFPPRELLVISSSDISVDFPPCHLLTSGEGRTRGKTFN